MSGRGQAVSVGGGASGPPVIQILLPSLIGPVGTDIMSTWFRVPPGGLDLTGALANITARSAPGTTAPSWDIARSTDSGGSFTTILPAGVSNKLQLPVAQKVVNLTPAWAVTTLDEGDLLRVDIAQTDDGSCFDVLISIYLQ